MYFPKLTFGLLTAILVTAVPAAPVDNNFTFNYHFGNAQCTPYDVRAQPNAISLASLRDILAKLQSFAIQNPMANCSPRLKQWEIDAGVKKDTVRAVECMTIPERGVAVGYYASADSRDLPFTTLWEAVDDARRCISEDLSDQDLEKSYLMVKVAVASAIPGLKREYYIGRVRN